MVAESNPKISGETMGMLSSYLKEKTLKDIFLSEMVNCNAALDTNWADEISALDIETGMLVERLMEENVDVKKSEPMRMLLEMHEKIKDLRDPNWRYGKDKKFKERLNYVGIHLLRNRLIDDYMTMSTNFRNTIVIFGGLDRKEYQVTADTREEALRKYMPALLYLGENGEENERTTDDGGLVRVEEQRAAESPSYKEINEELSAVDRINSYSEIPIDNLISGVTSLNRKVLEYGVDADDVAGDISNILKRLERMKRDGRNFISSGESTMTIDYKDASNKIRGYLSRLANSSK